jgi:hypothetical protein
MANMTATTMRRIIGCPFLPVSNGRLEITTFAGANMFRHACFGRGPLQPRQLPLPAPSFCVAILGAGSRCRVSTRAIRSVASRCTSAVPDRA